MTLGQKGNKKTHTHKNNQTNKPQKNLNKQKPKQKSKQKPKQEKNTKQDKKNPNKKNSHELASLTRPYTLKIYKHLIQTEIDYHQPLEYSKIWSPKSLFSFLLGILEPSSQDTISSYKTVRFTCRRLPKVSEMHTSKQTICISWKLQNKRTSS